MKQLFKVISKKTKLKCLCVVILTFFSSILASIWPVKLGELYTNISNGTLTTINKALDAILFFAIIYLFAECISIMRRVALDCIVVSHEAELREKSIEKLMMMPTAYLLKAESGEKTAQLNQGVAGLSQLIKIICNDVLATVLTAGCTLVQVLVNAPVATVIIMLSYLTLTIIVSIFQIHSQNGVRESIVNQKNALDGKVCQSITNLELIRGMNAEQYEKNRLLPRIMGISNTEKKHHRYMGIYDCAKQMCKIACQVALLISSVILISRGSMSAGTVITVCLLFQQLVKPVDEVYRFMDETASAAIKAKVLTEVTTGATDEIFGIKATREKDSSDDITIKDLVIIHPENDCLIKYKDLLIPTNKRVALQGTNGSGKSSLARCLIRYYPYVQGEITVFGREHSSLTQKELTDRIYYTPQKSFFIAGTVRENLLYGMERAVSDDELIFALSSVHLTGWNHDDTVIRKDPHDALNCMISEKAEELSGGMKQRLSLARAFLRHPKFYIFDEITANLDKESVSYVLDNIESYAKNIGAGIMYISHDQQVVERCDQIISLTNKGNPNSSDRPAA